MKDVISVYSNSKSEDTLEEQLMEVMLYVRTTHEVEHNDNQWTKEFVYSFDEAKAKINRFIVEARLDELKRLWDVSVDNRMTELSKELEDK